MILSLVSWSLLVSHRAGDTQVTTLSSQVGGGRGIPSYWGGSFLLHTVSRAPGDREQALQYHGRCVLREKAEVKKPKVYPKQSNGQVWRISRHQDMEIGRCNVYGLCPCNYTFYLEIIIESHSHAIIGCIIQRKFMYPLLSFPYRQHLAKS